MLGRKPKPAIDRAQLTMAGNVVVEARELSKTYRMGRLEVPALRGVSLRIERGEIVDIVGPSGCGKTTLLHCLSGLEDFEHGEVLLEGQSLARLSDGQKADHRARRMGFVFQSYNLLPVLNALENVELPLLLSGRSAAEARRRAMRALEVVGLENRLRHRPSELSGGQQQRVAIARALSTEPAVIFADEPTGNLDSDSAEEVMQLRRDRRRYALTRLAELASLSQRERRIVMRSLFGVSQDGLLIGIGVLVAIVVGVLATAAWRNPLLPRLAWRNLPRRPGFAVLITLGLTIGTVILSSAFTTGDTMSQSVRTVVSGVLGTADEVAFIPAADQRSGWDLAQSIATGALLTGVTSYFPVADTGQISDLVSSDPRVTAVVPIIVEQAAVASDGQSFAAQLNLLGVPSQQALTLQSAAHPEAPLSVDDLQPDDVYLNTEAASALGVTTGQTVHAIGLSSGDGPLWTVKQVTRLGDLGAEATLPSVWETRGR